MSKSEKIQKILSYIVFAGIIIYLIYSLAILKNSLDIYHIILIIFGAIIPFFDKVSKVKIFNFFEYESKLEEYKKETIREISELRNSIESRINIASMPEQNVIVNIDRAISENLEPQSAESGIEKRAEDKIAERIESIRTWIYYSLFLTRIFQVAVNEGRMFDPKDLAIDIGIASFDERTTYLARQILDSGIDKLIPKVLIIGNEKGKNEEAFDIKEITEGLELVEWLFNLKNEISKNNKIKEDEKDVDIKIDKLRHVIYMLELILGFRGSLAILYEIGMMKKLNSLKREIEVAEKENRPINFPPEE